MTVRSGFLLINKPVGISSFKCIARLKKIISTKIKIGHAGTLDPFASGLLIVAIGRHATRLMPQLMTLEKTYVATAKLGELTDTLDVMGKVVQTSDASVITEKHLHESIVSFGSSYEQIPPIYSALKYQGVALYKLVRKEMLDARELERAVETKRKIVHLHDIQLISCSFPFFAVKAHVSHGTYIRSFMNDIAVRAGSWATTYELVRTGIGKLSVERSVALSQITSLDDINRLIIPIEDLDSF